MLTPYFEQYDGFPPDLWQRCIMGQKRTLHNLGLKVKSEGHDGIACAGNSTLWAEPYITQCLAIEFLSSNCYGRYLTSCYVMTVCVALQTGCRWSGYPSTEAGRCQEWVHKARLADQAGRHQAWRTDWQRPVWRLVSDSTNSHFFLSFSLRNDIKILNKNLSVVDVTWMYWGTWWWTFGHWTSVDALVCAVPRSPQSVKL